MEHGPTTTGIKLFIVMLPIGNQSVESDVKPQTASVFKLLQMFTALSLSTNDSNKHNLPVV